jgi:hypothetical protein
MLQDEADPAFFRCLPAAHKSFITVNRHDERLLVTLYPGEYQQTGRCQV